MTMKNHINELSNKHRNLDHEIQSAQRSAAVDSLELTKLKRQKLRLKEQLLNLAR